MNEKLWFLLFVEAKFDLKAWSIFHPHIYSFVRKNPLPADPFVFKGKCPAASWVANPQPLRPNQDNNTSLETKWPQRGTAS